MEGGHSRVCDCTGKGLTRDHEEFDGVWFIKTRKEETREITEEKGQVPGGGF